MINNVQRFRFESAFTVELEDVVSWIIDNLNPEDVFNDDDLDAWAIEKGYIWPE